MSNKLADQAKLAYIKKRTLSFDRSALCIKYKKIRTRAGAFEK
jgi:hypothetical protein